MAVIHTEEEDEQPIPYKVVVQRLDKQNEEMTWAQFSYDEIDILQEENVLEQLRPNLLMYHLTD